MAPRTDPGYLRDQVFARDRGICTVCQIDTVAAYNALKRARGTARAAGLHLYGMKSITARRSLWDADHIRPVAKAEANATSTTSEPSASSATAKPPPNSASA